MTKYEAIEPRVPYAPRAGTYRIRPSEQIAVNLLQEQVARIKELERELHNARAARDETARSLVGRMPRARIAYYAGMTHQALYKIIHGTPRLQMQPEGVDYSQPEEQA